MTTTRTPAAQLIASTEDVRTSSPLATALALAAAATQSSSARLLEAGESEDLTGAVPLGVDHLWLLLGGPRTRVDGLLDRAAALVRQAWVWQQVAGRETSAGGQIRRRNFLAWMGEKLRTALERDSDLALLLVEIEAHDPVMELYGPADLEERVPALYNAVERAVRGVDSVYRCDDATLAVVLPRCDRANAAKVADRIRAGLVAAGSGRRSGLNARLRIYAGPRELAALAPAVLAEEVERGDATALLRLWIGVIAGTFHAKVTAYADLGGGHLVPVHALGVELPEAAPGAIADAFQGEEPAVLSRSSAGLPSTLFLPTADDQGKSGLLVVESVHGSFGPAEIQLGRGLGAHCADLLRHAAAKAAAGPVPSTSTAVAARAPRYRHDYEGIIGQGAAMRAVFDLLERVIETDYPVIVQGESGTGKELIARAVHFNGRRREKPLIAENCAALNENLLEAELFGYEKGSFTGAETSRKGLFELADGGTLFLDEVADMGLGMQKDLLRILQEGVVRPVGGKKFLPIDVRVICASNRDLARLVEENKFRADLFYRLNVWSIHIPPLRERREDLPALVDHFLGKIAQQTGTPRKRLGKGVLDALVGHDWPGNIRELKNEIARMVALSSGDEIVLRDFSKRGSGEIPRAAVERSDDIASLEEVERQHIVKVLRHTNGNRARAAELLGINKATIYRKLKYYRLEA